MNLRPLFYVLILPTLASCFDEQAGTPDAEATNTPFRIMPSNDDVLKKIYDPDYQVPDSFYVDERADTPQSYTVHHVKDESISYELCTDNPVVAQEWEAADNASRSVSGYYVDSVETDNYFEFVRELSYDDGVGNIGNATSPGFARVFKCSAVNRDGVDRNLRDGFAGVLNARPLSARVVRDFTEYLWQFTFFVNKERKVLQSFTRETDKRYEHTLLLGLAYSQGLDRCDRIEVVDWVWTVDKVSGEVSKDYNVLYEIEARLKDGMPESC